MICHGTYHIVALLPPIVISTSMICIGRVTFPVPTHHLLNCSLVVEVPSLTYLLPWDKTGPLTNSWVTNMIELRSFASGWKRSVGREVKFGRIDASTSPKVEIKISPFLFSFCLRELPNTGDHECPEREQRLVRNACAVGISAYGILILERPCSCFWHI